MRSLLVDGDREMCDCLVQHLSRHGVNLVVAHDRDAALRSLSAKQFDIAILGVNSPDGCTFELLGTIRHRFGVPVIMLNADGSRSDCIRAFQHGADDFVTKPFDTDELLARMNAIVRRAGRANRSGTISLGDVTFHPGRRDVAIDGRTVALTGLESALLGMLMRDAGQDVSRDRICRTVLGREPGPLDRSLDTHVSNLRRKLGRCKSGSPRILSVRGVGYRYAL